MSTISTQISVIDCRGSANEIGRMHGEAARDLIALRIGRWPPSLTAQRGNVDRYIGRPAVPYRIHPGDRAARAGPCSMNCGALLKVRDS